MKHLFLVLSLFTFIGQNFAQIFKPVTWEMSCEKISDDEYYLHFQAKIDDGWKIYSQYLANDDGPARTSFIFDEGDHFELSGKNEEKGKIKSGYDAIFDMEVISIYGPYADFKQKIKVKDGSKSITGYLEYMTCDDERCLPPTPVDFEFKLDNCGLAGGGSDAKAGGDKAKKKDLPLDDAQADNNISEKIVWAKENKGNILSPVDWTFQTKKNSKGNFTLEFNAEIEDNWYIYSRYLEGEDGPEPVTINLDPADHVKAVGIGTESSPKIIEEYDGNFDMELIKLKESAVFTQDISVTDLSKEVTGYVEFMTCTFDRCLNIVALDFKIDPSTLTVDFGEGILGIPEETDLGGPSFNVIQPDDQSIGALFERAPTGTDDPLGSCTTEVVQADTSNWRIFVLGLLGGLVALLTPCVFPMIPLTVSFFTKSSKDKKKGIANAFLYGGFIFLVYLLLSVPFHLMDSINPNILNEVSTNIWLNIGFFLVFIFFAFSFFGYYELTLPAKFTNRVSSAEGAGGILGIFFMALTLALVSFSCTGPILGSLLAGAMSSTGGAMQLTAGMAGFGLALALPFALFAAFPGWMNNLPRSGSWLNSVKVVLGFAEVALAFKFLSNADLVKRWGMLKIEPFLVIWIICAIGIGLYLLGKIKFPHDSPLRKISPMRIGLASISLLFAVYLMSGFRYNKDTETFHSLKLLSGLAPPVGYSWIFPKDCPSDFDCFKDYDKGMEYAKEQNKPVMIDYTGHACVNCRKMEEHVWPDKKIHDYIKDDYVLISLYVDEKIALPEEEQVTITLDSGTRKIRTKGQKWAAMQEAYFQNNSQPWYVLLTPDGQLLNNPVGYTPDADEYAQFLECGLETFEKIKGNQLGELIE